MPCVFFWRWPSVYNTCLYDMWHSTVIWYLEAVLGMYTLYSSMLLYILCVMSLTDSTEMYTVTHPNYDTSLSSAVWRVYKAALPMKSAHDGWGFHKKDSSADPAGTQLAADLLLYVAASQRSYQLAEHFPSQLHCHSVRICQSPRIVGASPALNFTGHHSCPVNLLPSFRPLQLPSLFT